MSTINNNTIGLFGYGVVGQGFYQYILENETKKRFTDAVIKSPNKERANTEINFIENGENLLNSTIPTSIVEVINNDVEAFEIVSAALKKGKLVVTANKKLVATRLKELLALEAQFGGKLLYEAAVAGSIPIIRIFNDFYQHERINSIQGILNGSSNFILDLLFNSDLNYKEALVEAQKRGFAELDPIADVGGWDATYKLIILTLQGFGAITSPDEILNIGIQSITEKDIELAKKYNLKIKQIATAKRVEGKLELSVVPTLVDSSNELFSTDQEYNAIRVELENIGVQFFKGKGAGSLPTGSVVYADLKAGENNYCYRYNRTQGEVTELNTEGVEAFLLRIPLGFNLNQLPFKPLSFTKIDDDLYLVKAVKQQLLESKEYIASSKLSLLFFENENIKELFSQNVQEISVNELLQWKQQSEPIQLIDVREKWEFEYANIGGELIPLGDLENNLNRINNQQKVVVLCRSGKRSADAVELLQRKYKFNNLYNLKGGILAWADEIDETVPKY